MIEKQDQTHVLKPTPFNVEQEKNHIEQIREGNAMAFKTLFDKYYVPLSAFASEYVRSYDAGREVVQEVFVKIWSNKEEWNPKGSIKPYLYKSVYNQALNFKKKEDTRKKYESAASADYEYVDEDAIESKIRIKELRIAIRDAVRLLPPKRHMVFVLHRQHGLSIKEIALIMGITPKTVENQMTEALKFLRTKLKESK